MQPNIPARCVIRNFIEYNRRPFNARDIVKDTGIKHKTVRNILPQLVQQGHIKVILREKQGNIYVKALPDEDGISGKQYDWKPSRAKLRAVFDSIPEYPTAKLISEATGYSRETTFRLLRILRIEGCVRRTSRGYEQIHNIV